MPENNGSALVIFESIYSLDLSRMINKREDSRVADNEADFDITDNMRRISSTEDDIERYLEQVYMPV